MTIKSTGPIRAPDLDPVSPKQASLAMPELGCDNGGEDNSESSPPSSPPIAMVVKGNEPGYFLTTCRDYK